MRARLHRHLRCRKRRREGRPRRGEQSAHERAQHVHDEHDQYDQAGKQFRDVANERVLPERDLFDGHFFRLHRAPEGRVDDVHAVAALLVVADRVLYEPSDIRELLRRQRRFGDIAVIVRRVHVVHEHCDREPLQSPSRLLRVGNRAIDLVVSRGLTRGIFGRRDCVPGRDVLIGCVRPGCRFDARRQRHARRGRLIRQRSWHAPRAHSASAAFLRGLLAAHDLAVRPVLLARFLGRRKLDVCDDLRPHASGTDERREQGLDAALIALFHIARDFELLLANRELVIATRRRQQPALLVDDGDLFRLELRDAGGDEVCDRSDLLRLEASPGLQLHEYRCARRTSIAYESGLPRKREMNTCTCNRLQVRNRARELGFERVLIAGSFHELAHAESRIFRHHGESAIAFRQALTGQLEPNVVHAIGRHRDRARRRIQLIGNAIRIERLRDLRGILLAEVAVEQRIGRLLRPQHDADAGRNRRRNADEHRKRLQARRNQRRPRQSRIGGAHERTFWLGNRLQAAGHSQRRSITNRIYILLLRISC